LYRFDEYPGLEPLLIRQQIYGGKSLFDQFDSEVQHQIHVFLEQATGVLSQAYQLLKCRQENSLPYKETPEARPKSFQRLRWSLLDKKRVEVIVRDFSELNGRVHESIKLWCLGTSIGVDLQHLKRLENDANSRKLGFDVDARLQMATNPSRQAPTSLEFCDPDLRTKICDVEQFGDKFVVFNWDGKPVLVEYRTYAPESPVPVELDERTRDLVDKLANLLHQPKEIIFRAPDCQGWVRQMQQNRIAFMFAIHEGMEPSPVSLLKVLSLAESSRPSLSQRFRLATKLSRCISQLQLVKWVRILPPSLPDQPESSFTC
jgi:hypothetical protein